MKNIKDERDQHDIFYDVIEEVLDEVFEPIQNYLNSQDFKTILIDRLKKEGVEIELKNMDEVEDFGNGMSLQKYRIDHDDLVDCIMSDIKTMELTQ